MCGSGAVGLTDVSVCIYSAWGGGGGKAEPIFFPPRAPIIDFPSRGVINIWKHWPETQHLHTTGIIKTGLSQKPTGVWSFQSGQVRQGQTLEGY